MLMVKQSTSIKNRFVVSWLYGERGGGGGEDRKEK